MLGTTMLTMELKDRIEKSRLEEAKIKAALAARARAADSGNQKAIEHQEAARAANK